MNLLEINLDKLKSVLGTDLDLGLTGEQVLRNRREFGENVLREKPNTAASLLKKIFGDVMMIGYLITGLFDYLQNKNVASLICLILVAVLYAAFVLGAFLYGKRVGDRVEKYSRSRIHVRRNGRVVSISKSELVPGDILLLDKGDVMPCDGVILVARGLKVLEAGVTGQRVPVIKHSHEQVQSDEKIPYFECILFAGTVILQGSARVFVCNTGRDIFDSGNFAISRQNGTVPRIYNMAMDLKKQILLLWILACFIIFSWGVFRGQDVFSIFYYSVAMVIAAFPGSIEHFCDLSIAYMTDRLFREGIVLRNPGAIDLLCDANCIFVNSADYLFYAKPQAGVYFVGEREYDFREDHVPAKPLLEDLILSQPSRAFLSAAGNSEERKNENAIMAAAARVGLQKRALDKRFMHINQADPDPGRHFSCSLVLRDDTYRLVMRGEPEQVLSSCAAYRVEGDDLPLTEGAVIHIRGTFRRAAAQCERIIAVAERSFSSPPAGDVASHCHD
ncbi:MAG: cation-transporting P-type ATPase, partial [Clostridia bacterium]|nr:cation-transporting P-type ATPase [Clostridia bacterium]